MNQAMGQVPADAVAALHRPDRSANLRAAASISAYPAVSVPYVPAASTVACSSMTSIVAGRLCGSIPVITPAALLLRYPANCPARRALLLRAGQTPFEPLPARCPARSRP